MKTLLTPAALAVEPDGEITWHQKRGVFNDG